MGLFSNFSRYAREEVVATGDDPGRRPRMGDSSSESSGTKTAMTALVGLAAAGFLLILLLAIFRKNGLYFLTWATIAAGAALVAGGALGMLFGLPTPTTTTVINTNSASTPAGGSSALASGATGPVAASGPGGVGDGSSSVASDSQMTGIPLDAGDIGYRDSTSLEQVADWLTKIIIGLTLTQYSTWEDKFERLATNLSVALLGLPSTQSSPSPSAIPGGALLAFYSVVGFLVSYLWMRRFFILEMVTAKREAREALQYRVVEYQRRQAESLVGIQQAQAQAEVEAARREEEKRKSELATLETALAAARAKGLAPTDSSTPSSNMVRSLRAALSKGAEALPPATGGVAELGMLTERIGNPPPDPEDPWRGRFGGSETLAGLTLSAKVSQTTLPGTFHVELEVRSGSPERTTHVAGMKAVYFLHPTFGYDPRISTFASDGRAPLDFYAWGAFTVGVVVEDGTKLELNLATLPSAPDLFRIR